MLVEAYLFRYNLCLRCWIKRDSDGVGWQCDRDRRSRSIFILFYLTQVYL